MDIKELYISDISEVAEFMIKDASNLDDIGSITAFGYYEDIAALLKDILSYDKTFVCDIELHGELMRGYSDIFSLTIGEDFGIWIEPMYVDGEYLGYDAEKVYIADDCSTAILKKNENKNVMIYSFGYGEYDEECCGCCDCCDCKEGSGEKELTPKPTATYKVNGKEVDYKTYVKVVEKFDNEFEEKMKEMELLKRMMFGW